MRTSNSPARVLYAAALNATAHLRKAGKMSDSGRWWRLSSMVLMALLWIGGGWSEAAAQTQPRAYLLRINAESTGEYAEVTVIDTATKTVIATIRVGPTTAFGEIAVTPDGSRVYVTDSGSTTVSVIDAATKTVIATIPVGLTPRGIAITPDGSRAYVTNINSDTVSVIDTATNTVIATIPVSHAPSSVAITPDGSRAYVTTLNPGTVTVIDTASNQVVDTIPVDSPIAVAITPDGSRAYVKREWPGDAVSVIDTATKTVIATISVSGSYLYFDRIAITPDGSRAYVTNSGNYTVSVIDTATTTVIATIPVGFAPRGVAFTPDGSRAYVADYGVSVIDTASNQIVDTIGGVRCFGIAIGPAPPDEDGDGVANGVDQCPGTAAGEVVDATGCSIPQLAPCAGPSPGKSWRNHGAYVSTVTYVAERFLAAGLITSAQKDAIVSAAAKSSCGK